MAKNDNLSDFLGGIAKKLRTFLKTTAKINPQDFELSISKVYSEGAADNARDFWNTYQSGGGRRVYRYAFFNWPSALFKPKYDITPSDATRIFSYLGEGETGFNFKDLLAEQGITFSTKSAKTVNGAFNCCYCTEIGCVDLSVCNDASILFAYAPYLKKIDELRLSNTRRGYTCNFTWAFLGTFNLTDIKITGLLGENIDFTDCTKLSNASIRSIIAALDDFSGESTSPTLTLGSKNRSKLTQEQIATITQKGWNLA